MIDIPSKPSEHEQGLWVGFLNIFRYEKKRTSVTGVPPSVMPEGPSLGESHDLPDHDLTRKTPGTEGQSCIAKEGGSRASRKVSALASKEIAAAPPTVGTAIRVGAGVAARAGVGAGAGEVTEDHSMQICMQVRVVAPSVSAILASVCGRVPGLLTQRSVTKPLLVAEANAARV